MEIGITIGYSVNVFPHSPVAVVNIEKTLYRCNEEDGSVEVCVAMSNSAVVSFSFNVRILTVLQLDTAGSLS